LRPVSSKDGSPPAAIPADGLFSFERKIMTAPTVVQSLTGAVLSISATLPDTYDAAGYQSTDIIWTAVGQIEDHGAHGGTKTITEFIPVDTGDVAKVGGSINWGNKSLMLGNLAGDAGQILLRTALANRNTHYSFKIVYSDTGATTPETHFLDALVAKFENQDGSANSVRKAAVDLAICRQPVIVAPT